MIPQIKKILDGAVGHQSQGCNELTIFLKTELLAGRRPMVEQMKIICTGINLANERPEAKLDVELLDNQGNAMSTIAHLSVAPTDTITVMGISGALNITIK